MLNSNYNQKNLPDPAEALKKKLLKPKLDQEAPSIEEMDALLQSKPTDASLKSEAKKSTQITGGNYDEITSTAKIAPSLLDDKKGATASKVMGAATGALDMVASVAANKEPMNGKERAANVMSMTTKGAAAGSSFGPWGTAIGGAAGAVTGLAMGIGDEKELNDTANREKLTMLEDTKNKRMKAQRLAEGETDVANGKAALEAQMGMIGSKYSKTKSS
jgi:hypothetical protein